MSQDNGALKRFYETVEVRAEAGAYGIALDGRAVKTPLKRPFVVPTHALATALAAEWAAQEDYILPASMPLVKLANTAIDHGAEKAAAIVADIVAYAGADLLCYRAEEPEGLVARQRTHWDPLLAWVTQRFGAELTVTAGIVHRDQPEPALAACKAQAETYDPFRLTALHTVTTLTGSAVIALALAERHIAAQSAWAAANVDQDWQTELWGRDEEAERMRAARRAELDAADRFLEHVLVGREASRFEVE